jgi:hypothetical protein
VNCHIYVNRIAEDLKTRHWPRHLLYEEITIYTHPRGVDNVFVRVLRDLSRARPVRSADNHVAIYEPIV